MKKLAFAVVALAMFGCSAQMGEPIDGDKGVDEYGVYYDDLAIETQYLGDVRTGSDEASYVVPAYDVNIWNVPVGQGDATCAREDVHCVVGESRVLNAIKTVIDFAHGRMQDVGEVVTDIADEIQDK